MRVTGTHRKSEKRKFEGPRIAGIGLMMVGALALVLSVAGAAGAGSSTKAADPAHHTCGTVNTEDGPMAQVLQAVQYGNCGWNTTTTYKHTTCTCSTSSTEASTTMVSGTTDVIPTTEASTTMAPTTMAPTTMASTTEAPTAAPTTPTTPETNDIVVPTGGGDTTTSLGVKGISVQSSPTSLAVEPTSEVLPFTGSNTMPLAIAGFVMLATGFGLTRTRTKRRLAR